MPRFNQVGMSNITLNVLVHGLQKGQVFLSMQLDATECRMQSISARALSLQSFTPR